MAQPPLSREQLRRAGFSEQEVSDYFARRGELPAITTTAKAPGPIERSIARAGLALGKTTPSLYAFGEEREQMTPAQRQQLERARGARFLAEDIGKGIAGQPERTVARSIAGVAKLARMPQAEALVEKSRRIEEATEPQTTLGLISRFGAEAAAMLPGGVLTGAVRSAIESASGPEQSMVNLLARQVGLPEIQNTYARSALDMALDVAVPKAVRGVFGRRGARAAEEATEAVSPKQAAEIAGPPVRSNLLEGVQRPTREGVTPRATPLTEEIDPTLYARAEQISNDPKIQQRYLEATRKFVQEVETPLRVTPEDKAAGLFPGKRVGALREAETFDQIRKQVADDLGLPVHQIASRSSTGAKLDRFDLLRVRTAVNDLMIEEDELFKLINEVGADPEQVARARFRLGELAAERNGLLDTFTTARTQTGRDLNALKITALRTMDPVTWMARIQQAAQRPLTEAEQVAIRQAANRQDKNALFRIASETQKSTLPEKFIALVKAGMLSAPRTFLSNLGGTTISTALEAAKDVPATVFDTLIGGYTGTRTKSASIPGLVRTAFTGARAGVDDAMRVMRGELPSTAQLDMPREVRFDTPILNHYTRAVFRSLSATDQFFKNMAIARSVDEQARLLARAEGLRGDAFKARAAELIQRPTDEMAMRAIADAEIATFQETSGLSQAAVSLRNYANKATGGIGGDLLFPFTKTPANIAVRIYEYSPANLVYQTGQLAKLLYKNTPNAALQRQVVEGLGRGTTGSIAAVYLGYKLAQDGRMTGFYPRNQRERDQWETSGKVEGAIKLTEDSDWLPVAKYSPLGNLLQIGAAMYEMKEDPGTTAGTAVLGAATAPFRSVAELPMMANVNDIIEAFQKFGTAESADAITGITGRLTTGMIPGSGLVRSVTAATDPLLRETKGANVRETAINRIMASLPGASEQLPPRVDPLGRIAQRGVSPLGAFFNPSVAREDLTRIDPVRAELERTNANVGRITRDPRETGEQFAQREIEVGSTIRQVLAAVMQSPAYVAIGQMPIANARQALEAYNEQLPENERIDLAKISDDRIRSRLQGKILERVSSTVKSQMRKGREQTFPSQLTPFMESIVR